MIVGCHQCPWEMDVPSRAIADKRLANHLQRRHEVPPLQGVTQLDGVAWREKAFTAVDVLNGRGDDWTFYDLTALVGDPANAKTEMGNFAKDVHRLGRAHPIGWQRSSRPDTAKSGVRTWSGDASRCVDCKAGVPA